MALDASRLAQAIVTAIQAVPPPNPRDGGTAFLTAYWTVVAQQIIDEFQDNAQIIVTSVTGVQTGGSSSGPGTGTIT